MRSRSVPAHSLSQTRGTPLKMQSMAMIYLTASPPQSSASPLPRLTTVLDAIPGTGRAKPGPRGGF